MSSIIWNLLYDFLISENWSISFWNNCKRKVINFSDFDCVNFSNNLRSDYTWFIDFFYIYILYWDVSCFFNLDWLNSFVFQRNVVVTIHANYWVLQRRDCSLGSEQFFEFLRNDTDWDVGDWTNFECINLSFFCWSDWFQLIYFFSRSSVNWNVFNTIKCNWFGSFVSDWNIVLTVDFNDVSGIVWFFNFLNILESRCKFLWNDIQWNVSDIFNCDCIDFSFDFWLNWLSFINLLWSCWFNWNIDFIINIDWFYCLILQWNKWRTIYDDDWILWNSFLCRSE